MVECVCVCVHVAACLAAHPRQEEVKWREKELLISQVNIFTHVLTQYVTHVCEPLMEDGLKVESAEETWSGTCKVARRTRVCFLPPHPVWPGLGRWKRRGTAAGLRFFPFHISGWRRFKLSACAMSSDEWWECLFNWVRNGGTWKEWGNLFTQMV